jgi:hypothetical protein
VDPAWIVGSAFLAYFCVYAYMAPKRRITRALRAARLSRLADLPENTVGRVAGVVRTLGEPLTAPLSGRVCVYYVAKVEDNANPRNTLLVEEKGVPFIVEDDSGRAVIDPTNAKVTLVFDHESDTVNSTWTTPEQEALLVRYGISSKGFMGAKPMHFSEAIIESGEKVAVLGSGIRDHDHERTMQSGYRDAPPTLLRLTSSARYPLLISDIRETTEPS